MKTMNTKVVGMALTMAALLVACGPEKSATQLENDQIAANVQAQIQQLQPVVGTYCGTVTYDNGWAPGIAQLSVTLNTNPQVNPGRNDTEANPTLGGAFSTLDSNAVDADGKGSSWDGLLHYNTGNFDGTKVTLTGTDASGGTTGFTGKLNGSTLAGTVTFPSDSGSFSGSRAACANPNAAAQKSNASVSASAL